MALLTLLTGSGLLATVVVVALWGRQFVFQKIEDTYIEAQHKTAADQARRIARLLEQELAAGVPAATVQRHLQESLSRSPYDAAGFLCLLDSQATVLCHPNVEAIGMRVPFAADTGTPDGRARVGEWLNGQDYAGDIHLVARQAVAGTPWHVSVHTNYRTIQARVAALRRQVTLAALPLLAGFVLLGTAAVRVTGRVYERRIEEANRQLEAKVAARTVELTAASRYHQEIIEAAPSAIFLCDGGGVIRRANTQAAVLSGRPVEALGGVPVGEIWQWSEMPGISGKATPLAAREAQLRTPDGRVRQLHVFTRTLREEHGGETMFVVQDVTALKTLEQEFLQAQKMEAVGQLAGGVAHDFNNLLAAILGFVDLARMATREPSAKERLHQAAAACQRAGRLSQQLLAFSRRQVLERRVLRLPALVEEVRRVLERVLGDGVTIQTEHEASPWSVKVDPMQFEQALLNLAINARDAMNGQGMLFLRTRNVPAGAAAVAQNCCLLSDSVCLEVEDTGPGIPPEFQARIFEPFFTTKEVGRGTGLGLASVLGIVQQHGGHIELESAPGCGARFLLLFPRHEGAEAPDAPARTSRPGVGRGLSVLVVEDEPALLESLCALLESRGCRCTGCATRADALKLLSGVGHFDAVVSDVVMPGVSVEEFLRVVRARSPDIRIVLMSGYAAEEVGEAGAAGPPILRKPFEVDQLIELLPIAPASS